ncbi:MAG: SH3 domain-containing protein [Dehalococcoidia bacterium]|nr:SH3 domain-containing protein [Dehalococcoidia bacterium]
MAVLLGSTALAAGCGDEDELRPSTMATPTLVDLPAETATVLAPEDEEDEATPTATPGPTESPSPTPEATEEPDSGSNVDAVLAAASAQLGVPYGDACSEDEDCVQQLPGGIDPGGDIARLAYASASGGGAIVVMARDGAGEWGLWMLTQSPYQLLQLPGQVLACERPTVVHEQPAPGAAAIGEVERGEPLQATGFVLSERGSISSGGAGWYSVGAPIEGWVYSREVTRASDASCALRDAAEGEPNPRG